MVPRERHLILLGGVLAVAGLAGLAWSGTSLAAVFAVMNRFAAKGPAPQLAGRLTCTGVSAVVVGLGLSLTALGFAAQGRGIWLSKWGRTAVAAAGFLLACAGGLVMLGLWRIFGEFARLAESQSGPAAGDIDRLIQAGEWLLQAGFILGLAGQSALLAAAWKGFWIDSDGWQHPAGGKLALPFLLILASVGFSVMIYMASVHGGDAAALSRMPVTSASEFAGRLVSLARCGMLGGTLLFLAGATQSLGAALVPKR